MLTNARQILVSELALAKKSSEENIEGLIDDRITKSFANFRIDNVVENTGVNKFIPFDDDESSSVVG